MKNLTYLGRLMFVFPFLILGFGHFGNGQALASMVPEYLPYPIIWVYLTGLALILAAIAIVINKMAKLAALLLGIMLVLFAFLVHLPNVLNGAESSAMASLLKDLGLAGGAFFISGTSRSQ
jgi:uncharacterized membrane protein